MIPILATTGEAMMEPAATSTNDRAAIRLAAALTLGMLAAWGLQARLGTGTNSGFILGACVAAALLVRPARVIAALRAMEPLPRSALALYLMLLTAAQLVHLDSWRAHRDYAGVVLATAIALGIGRPGVVLEALRYYGVALVLLFYGLLALAPGAGIYETGRFGGPFHPNATALQAALALAAVGAGRYATRILPLVLTAALVGVVLICGSRAALLASGAIALGTVARIGAARKRGKPPLVPLAAFVAATALVAPVSWRQLLVRDGTFADLSTIGGRMTFWPEYLRLLGLDPLVGLGDAGSFAVVDTGAGVAREIPHPHSSWLAPAVAYGIPVALALLAVHALAALRAWRRTGGAAFAPPERWATVVIFVVAGACGLLEPFVTSVSNNGAAAIWLLAVTTLAAPAAPAATAAPATASDGFGVLRDALAE